MSAAEIVTPKAGGAVVPGQAAARETRSTCPYCGVGCGVIIESQGSQITQVRGDPDHPANWGRLCSKGSTLAQTASAPITLHQRLLRPQLHGHPVSWDTALETAAQRMADTVARHGPDSVGLYLSGQLLTEDYYVFNKLAKGLVGTNNLDTNSRLCMSSAVAAYKATLGADAPPCNYEDLDHAQTVFIAGSNMAWAHPVLFRRLEDAKQANPGQRWIVVDPRRTETAQAADLHLQILPGTDVALFHGMLHLLLWEGLVNQPYIDAHTSGFAALRDRVRAFHPTEVARLCGIREDQLVQAARWFAQGPTLSLYCQGLNQSHAGTDKNSALINLHLATGQIGKAGAGPFSLTGQPNAMGGREVGGLANLLSGHRDMANPRHRAEVAALWGVAEVPAKPGKTAVEMFQAAADGAIRLLWIACTNPAQSLPDQALVRRALERAEFVIVQEAFAHTETTPYADLLLPASSWGEKEGTVTNSERRISRVRAAVPAPGMARADWAIAVDVAQRLEQRLRPGQASLFDYPTPESVWLEHRSSTVGRDLDISGLSYARLEQEGPLQWPCAAPGGQTDGGPATCAARPADDDTQAAGLAPSARTLLQKQQIDQERSTLPTPQTRLYTDGKFATPDGRARFADLAYRPVAEARDARHPFSLNTGRLRDQWHGMSRTGTLGRLFGHSPEPVVEMHAQDMARLKISDGDLVRLQSRRGMLVMPAASSAAMAPTQVFIAMHWGAAFVGGSERSSGQPMAMAGVNALSTSSYCPTSKQPELKHAAVRIEAARLPWRLLAAAWLPADQVAQVQARLRALTTQFGYASVVPFGHQGCGLLMRAAAACLPGRDCPEDEIVQATLAIEAALGLAADDRSLLRFVDASRGQRRIMRLREVAASGQAASPAAAQPAQALQLQTFVLAGDTRAANWLLPLLQQQQPAQGLVAQLLRPGIAPGSVQPTRVQVCNCLDVDESAIRQCLQNTTGEAHLRLKRLQAQLRCGTACGSCLPALRQWVARTSPIAAVEPEANRAQPA